MLTLEHISKTFTDTRQSVEAVKDVSLSVAQGEIFGIIGASGAGKSTLVRCINLLERPETGKVTLGDVELSALPEKALRAYRRKIGMIFQHFNLMASRTVMDNVLLPLKDLPLSPANARAKAQSLLALVGLSDKEHAYPSQLSGGQKQRVAIMEDGRVVEMGDVFDIFSKPRENVTREFIDTTSPLNKIYRLIAQKSPVVRLQPGQRILKLKFQRKSASQALISEVSRRFNVDMSIIFGDIEIIADAPLGGLVVIMGGESEQMQAAIAYLTGQDVDVEVIDRA